MNWERKGCILEPYCLRHFRAFFEHACWFSVAYFQVVLSSLLPALDQLLEEALSRPDGLLKDKALLLHLILGKYNQHSAALLCTSHQCLELFVKCLHISQEIYKGLSAFQIRALGQVRKRQLLPIVLGNGNYPVSL